MNDKTEKGRSLVLLCVIAASVAAATAGREVGIKAAYGHWENLLVASGLANPEIAEKVAVNCWERRNQFAAEAESRRKLFEAVRVLRDRQAGPVVETPKPVAPVESTKPNTEPKPDAP